MPNRKIQLKWFAAVSGVVVLLILSALLYVSYKREIITDFQNTKLMGQDLPLFTLEELKNYSGQVMSQPIYVGLNSYVYDVSAGGKLYQPGGPYNYLTGKDSSEELNLIGGETIAKKYPIVGRLP
jgi:predicted heme/steroid binding protein